MSAELQAPPIDLAHEAPFALGGAQVRPATLEVAADGKRETLEPRVMQVLVALARRRGEVVSRDELIAQCWGGRIVGEDAVTRSIGKLRKLAEACGGFEIETVPRVGFRLVEGAAERPAGRLRLRRPAWLGVTLAVALVLAAAGTWVWRQSLPVEAVREPRIAVRAFEAIGDDPSARAFAASLTDDVSGFLGEKAVGFAIEAAVAGREPSGDLMLGGAVDREADAWRVRAYLEDRPSGVILWSQQFERPLLQEAALRDEVAAAVTDVTYHAVLPLAQEGLKLDPQTLALHIAAFREWTNSRPIDDARILRLFEQVTARAPDFAWARGAVSANLTNASRTAPPEERAALERRARAEAERAIRSDPTTAEPAYDSLYILARLITPDDLAAAEDVLLKGIAASPETPWLHMRECRFLVEVGRAADALRYCDRARALRPLSPSIDASYVFALYAAGQLTRAQQAAEETVRFHPTHSVSLWAQFEIEGRHGDPERARALAQSFGRRFALDEDWVRATTLLYQARKSGAAADTDKAMAALWRSARSDPLAPRTLVLGAASLGRPDDAFRAIETFGAAPPRSGVGYVPATLLEPAAASLRRDPRFWQAAAKAGYVRYWRTRGKWPDFCSDPGFGIDCRKAAAAAGV